MLWALSVLPLLVGLHLWLLARARRRAASFALAWRETLPPAGRWRGTWRRHGPALLLLMGIAVMLVSLTRPRAVLMLPTRMEGVMLAIDSSGSMRADDIKPSRIEAAQATARRFVESQPAHVKLGVVSIAGTAAVVQAPTEDRDSLRRAIDNLPLQRGSALGSGIVIALAAMLPTAGIDVARLIDPQANNERAGGAGDRKPPKPAVPQVKLEPGSNDAVAIVLMTDGQGNFGPDTLKMAQVAADLGVRVHTIGFGTPEGTVLRAQGVSVRVKLDEAVLVKVAQITRGEYFRAATGADLERIYRSLGMRIVMKKHRQSEVTALVLMLGMGLVLAGAGWSIGKTGRVV